MTVNDEMVPVCPAGELAVDELRGVETPWGPVVVVRAASGIYAVTDRCTHDDVPLSDGFVEGDTVECPAHLSLFCLRTGAALTMPATEPVETWAVEVIDEVIYLKKVGYDPGP